MVSRTPPLAVAVIGTGAAPSKKALEALLNDYTAPYADVTFILPVTDAHWSEGVGVVADWVIENEIDFVAVTTGEAPSKALVPYLEAAADTQKVARVSTKTVQLLKGEQADGDVALLVLWDEDDPETVLAVNKALTSEVKALNLLDGLDEFTFDDDEDQGVPEPDESTPASPVAELPEDEGPPAKGFTPGDDYDDWGVRKLRAALREHPNKKHTDRQIGQLDKDDAIRALRVADQAALRGDAPDQDAEPEDEPTRAETTTRARRAFAEGAAEGSGDEAQSLPRSRGGDLLEEQDGDPTEEGAQSMAAAADALQEEDERGGGTLTSRGVVDYDDGLRHRALELAIAGGKSGSEAIKDAEVYALYLRGERRSPGRPRADGSPAQPREINPETGKPIRRRGSRSTE